MIKIHYGKDQHGLHEKDVDHQDKQNFDTVMRIINASSLLDKFLMQLEQNITLK